jgi:hypothetical protein
MYSQLPNKKFVSSNKLKFHLSVKPYLEISSSDITIEGPVGKGSYVPFVGSVHIIDLEKFLKVHGKESQLL